jgi:TP901 family phage tail tape measure protein
MFSDVFVNFVSNVDSFTDELRQVNFQLNVMASLAKNTEQSMRALVYVGFQIGRTLANMLTSAAESFIELDQGIANLSTVLTATEETYEKLTDQIMAWSNQHVTSTNEAIQATYNMASAGLSQAEVFATVDKAATLSTAAMGTMDQATQLLTDSMNSFGKSMDSTATAVEKATDFMNGYAYVVQQFKIILPELQAGMARVAGAATTVGAEFGEAAVALGALKTSGLTVSQAGTALKNFYERLGKLSNDLNINLTDNNGNLLQISEILKLVQGAYGGAVDSLSEFADLQVILGKRGSLVVTLLQNQIDSLAAHEKAVRTSADAAEMAAKREEGLAAQIQILTNSFDNFKKVMGEALLPIIAGVTDAFQKITLGLQAMDDVTKNNVVRIGALVAAVGVFLGLATPLTLGLFKIASGLAAVAGAATATATAVGFATAGLFVLGGTLAATVIINSVKAAGALEQTSLKAQELANSAVESNNRLISLAETLDEITDSGRNYDTTNSELVSTIQQLIKYLPQFRSLLSLDGTEIDASILKLREFTQEVGTIADNARKANRYRLEVEIDEASKNLERVSHDLVSLNELIVQVSEDPITPIQFDSSTEDSFRMFARLQEEFMKFKEIRENMEDTTQAINAFGDAILYNSAIVAASDLSGIDMLSTLSDEEIEQYRSFVSVVETLGISLENATGEVKSYDEILSELFALQEQYTAEIENTQNSLIELQNQYINTDEAATWYQET